MKKVNQKQLLGTHDLGCAAALMSAGYKLDCLDRTNPDRIEFLFKKTEGIEVDKRAYFEGSLEVDARNYHDSFKALKAQIYDS